MHTDSTEVYQIKVRGRLGEQWSNWFGGMRIAHETDGDGLPVTVISGAIADQPTLHGILWRLRDLNLKLISVARIETDSDR